jgi:hypothetical protein
MCAVAGPYEEWRLLVNVHDGGAILDDVVEEVRKDTEETVDVHRRGRHGIAVYAFTEEAARRAENTLIGVLRRFGRNADTQLTRWNPGRERWQDPALAIDPTPTPLTPDWNELGELAWEVRVKLEERGEARALEQDLRGQGRPTRSDGRTRFMVGAADQSTAAAIAEQIMLRAPFAKIEVRRLSRFRRWLIRQSVLGNYASPAGGGDVEGDWGGGGNGGGGAG